MAVAPVHETANGTDSLEPPPRRPLSALPQGPPEVDEWAVSKLLKWTHVDVARHKLNPTQQRQRRVQLDCDNRRAAANRRRQRDPAQPAVASAGVLTLLRRLGPDAEQAVLYEERNHEQGMMAAECEATASDAHGSPPTEEEVVGLLARKQELEARLTQLQLQIDDASSIYSSRRSMARA